MYRKRLTGALHYVLIVITLLACLGYIFDRRQRSDEIHKASVALGAAGASYWMIDSRDHTLRLDPGIYTLFHRTPETFPATVQGFLDTLHPADLKRITDLIEKAYRVGGTYEAIYRVIGDDGKTYWIRAAGGIVDAAGRYMSGICLPAFPLSDECYPDGYIESHAFRHE